jgi:hypothetical protein
MNLNDTKCIPTYLKLCRSLFKKKPSLNPFLSNVGKNLNFTNGYRKTTINH